MPENTDIPNSVRGTKQTKTKTNTTLPPPPPKKKFHKLHYPTNSP